jgi:hypothetical protein
VDVLDFTKKVLSFTVICHNVALSASISLFPRPLGSDEMDAGSREGVLGAGTHQFEEDIQSHLSFTLPDVTFSYPD